MSSALSASSALIEGRVTHTRLVPHRRHFEYPLALFALDLGDLDGVRAAFARFRGYRVEGRGLVSFRRKDYHVDASGDPRQPLDEAVRNTVQARLGFRPAGRVRLVTQLRTLGYVFNPVSFYLCEDADGGVAAILAEITNTPWSERFCYVLDAREQPGPVYKFRFQKDFHVSPFWDMDQQYEWRFHVEAASLGVHMTNHEDGRAVFHAGFEGQSTPLEAARLGRALWRYPFQPLRMHLAIYWHAARLWLKRTPFFTHPKKRPDPPVPTPPPSSEEPKRTVQAPAPARELPGDPVQPPSK